MSYHVNLEPGGGVVTCMKVQIESSSSEIENNFSEYVRYVSTIIRIPCIITHFAQVYKME